MGNGAGGHQPMQHTPNGSTQAQFQNSAQNLPRQSLQPPHMSQQPQTSAPRPAAEPEPTGFQKFIKVLCCG